MTMLVIMNNQLKEAVDETMAAALVTSSGNNCNSRDNGSGNNGGGGDGSGGDGDGNTDGGSGSIYGDSDGSD